METLYDYSPRLNDEGMRESEAFNDNIFANTPDCELPNCTCYCQGRIKELAGREIIISTRNARYWVEDAIKRGFEVNDYPSLSDVVVYDNGDGYGHVAIVEDIYNDTVVTGNSGYLSKRYFYTERYDMNNYDNDYGHGDILGYIHWAEVDSLVIGGTPIMTLQEKKYYVGECYAEYLGRPADEEGMETYCNMIPDDADFYDDLSYIDDSITSSDEYKDRQKRLAINNIYNVLLGRDADEEGMETYMGYAYLRDVYRDIYNSEEAENRRG